VSSEDPIDTGLDKKIFQIKIIQAIFVNFIGFFNVFDVLKERY
jgi:hypothetical protein